MATSFDPPTFDPPSLEPSAFEPPRVDPAFASDATVEISNVSVWFGPKVALSELSCSFGAGVTGLLGPNGAGKTTLMRAMQEDQVRRRVSPADGADRLTAFQLHRLAAWHQVVGPVVDAHLSGILGHQSELVVRFGVGGRRRERRGFHPPSNDRSIRSNRRRIDSRLSSWVTMYRRLSRIA